MITINDKWKYKVKFVKFPQDKYTSFSVGVKDKDKDSYTNYQMFSLKKYENLKDGDEVKITKIISTELAYWNDKPQLKVTCEIDIMSDGELNTEYESKESFNQDYQASETPKGSVSYEITDDSLPF